MVNEWGSGRGVSERNGRSNQPRHTGANTPEGGSVAAAMDMAIDPSRKSRLEGSARRA